MEAVDLASAEGLEALTIGRLAEKLGISKSGLFAHFGSKEDLQRATVERAAEIFSAEIITPTQQVEPGLPRLTRLIQAWLSYVERSVFRGGCFFAAASAEFDGRPGPVRDRIAELTARWIRMLEDEFRLGQRARHLKGREDASQWVFEVHAFVQEANWTWQLHGDHKAFGHARKAVQARLAAVTTATGRRVLQFAMPARSSQTTKGNYV
jgi:AcrR family transcriptional regulator